MSIPGVHNRSSNPHAGVLQRNGVVTPNIGPQLSVTHEKALSGEARRLYANRNLAEGGESTNLLDAALVLDIVSAYFGSFLEEDNPVIGWVRKGLDSVGQLFMGKRDADMYSVFASGIDQTLAHLKNGTLTPEDLVDTDKLIEKNIIPFGDDAMENATQIVNGEWFIPQLWKVANSFAKAKPFIYPFAPWLQGGLTKIVYTIFETPARVLWRCRFAMSSLCPDFVSKMIEISSYGVMGVFNRDYRDKYNNSKAGFRKTMEDHLANRNTTHGENHNYENKSLLGLTTKFIGARHAQHFRDMLNPQKAIQERVNDGVFTEDGMKHVLNVDEALKDRVSRAKERGEEINEEEISRVLQLDRRKALNKQTLSSITDFTAPFAAGYGLFASLVLDPLHSILTSLGVEKGMGALKGLAEARRTTQDLNYLTRLIFAEKPDNDEITKVDALANQEGAGKTIKALSRLLKNNRRNFYTGVGMSALSMIEPILHFKYDDVNDKTIRFETGSKSFNFFARVLQRVNVVVFLRYFSRRRALFGMESSLRGLVAEASNMHVRDLDKEGVHFFDLAAKVTDEKIEEIAASKKHLQAIDSKEKEKEIGFGFFNMISTKVEKIKDGFGGCDFRNLIERYIGIAA